MRDSASKGRPWKDLTAGVLVVALLSAALLMVFCFAPTEATMGEAQRILYLHVSVAWCGLAGCLGAGVCGVGYLVQRRLGWDHWSRAAAETGWLCLTLTLITGSFWARRAWGVWWTWEPRLTASLVLWLIYAGIFSVRSWMEDPHHRARVGAVLVLLALADLPLIVMATRWFRGIHPVSPEMDGRMQLTLRVAALGLFAFFVFLTVVRRRQLGLAEQVSTLEIRADGIDWPTVWKQA